MAVPAGLPLSPVFCSVQKWLSVLLIQRTFCAKEDNDIHVNVTPKIIILFMIPSVNVLLAN